MFYDFEQTILIIILIKTNSREMIKKSDTRRLDTSKNGYLRIFLDLMRINSKIVFFRPDQDRDQD